MVVAPDTDIFLLKCELKLDNKNQLTFDSQGDQYNYFTNLPKLELEGAKYQRKDGAIRYNGHFDDLIQYNYCMYRNNNYSDKWFFAFITGLEYLNDNCTLVYIKTDVFQTWQFDLEYKPSFVEREHIANDTVGANLVPEGVETGEYKIAGTSSLSDLEPVYIFAYSDIGFKYKTYDASGTETGSYDAICGVGQTINGIPQTAAFIAVSNATELDNLRRSFANVGNQSEKVIAFFTVPKLAVETLMTSANRLPYLSGATISYIDNIYIINGKATAQIDTFLARPTTIDGYSPRNKKLLTYPYVYLGFNSPFGSSQVFRYEDFYNATPEFKLISEVNPNPTVCIIPQNYRGSSGDNLSDMVTLNGYPQLSTKVDFYNSWLAENSGIINVQTQQQYYEARMNTASGALDLMGGLAGIGGSIASAGGENGSVGNAIMGGINSVLGMGQTAIGMYKNAANYDYYIKQLMATVERQKLLPDQVTMGGSNATILGYDLIDDNIFTRYNIKEQFARRIDGFFDMYGYQTNLLKVPEIDTRPYWNYIKTQGINIEGDVPENDLAEIRELFDNGVTLWHDAEHYLDYSLNNAPA